MEYNVGVKAGVYMKDYEIVATFLNDCAGAAHPQRSFEEVTLANTDDYIRRKHGEDFDKFQKEIHPNGQIIYSYACGVTYIYEFTEL